MDNNFNIRGLWCESYRPHKLQDLIVSDHTRQILEGFNSEIPNLLFVGVPGTGKTSTARIIVSDILKCDYLYINASDESGIDMIRNKVVNFAQTKSFDGGMKVVIFDECLEENTLVTVLADGTAKQLPIKDLDSTNHLVKTYNVATDTIEWRPFNHACQGEREVYELEFENGEKIICTDNHKWYVKVDNNIVRMKLIDIIKEGIMEIVTKTEMITLLNIKSIKKLEHKVTVYDIGVDGTNNFFVGKEQILTGNCDGLTSQAQGALRNIMEEHAKHTRFILTANYKHKIIPAVQSRCQTIDIKPTIEDAVKRCYSILKQEGVVVEGDQKQKFLELVKNTFPDMRKCINELQKNSIGGRLNIKETTVPNSLLKYIHECIANGETIELRRYIIGVEDTFYGDYDNLLKEYLNYLYEQDIEGPKKKTMIAIIADHLHRAVLVLDKEINAFACWINLERV